MIRWLHEKFLRPILSAHDSVEAVAGGVALGMGVALTPTLGVQMPIALLLVSVASIYNYAMTGSGWSPGLGVLLIAISVYSLVTWKILSSTGQKSLRESFDVTFLALDVIFVAWAVHLTGAESSWLLVLLPLRVADQAHGGFKRSLLFAHWVPFPCSL